MATATTVKPEQQHQQLLNLAKDVARQAGHEVMNIYHSGDFTAHSKSDESPVTSADYKANDIITHFLNQHTPNIPIISEEQSNVGLDQRKSWQRYWLIDPIDGTQEFIAGSGDFAINIALIENHQPVLGIIYWPVGDTLYYAAKGAGAYKQSPQQEKRIAVRQLADPDEDAVMVAISRRQSRSRLFSKMSKTRVYNTLPLGSCSLKACIIAEGKADVFLRLGETGEWDTGAAQCIVTEAGGQILAADFSPLTYNRRHTLTNPDFVVTGDQRVNWQEIVLYQSVLTT